MKRIISIPFVKGFGWGAELNIHYIFEKLFSCEKGMGYLLSVKNHRAKMQNYYLKSKKLLAKGLWKFSKPLIRK